MSLRSKRRVIVNGMIAVVIVAAVIWEIACEPRGGNGGGPGAIPGSAFVVMITGNWHGQLGPCGCSDHQLGGIDRRTHLIEAAPFERRLLIDTGPLIEADQIQNRLKLETFLYSMKHLGYDGVGLTADEMDIMDSFAIEVDQRPVVIASNLDNAYRDRFSIVKSVSKTLRCGQESLECLVFSVYQPVEGMGREEDRFAEPLSAIRQAIQGHGLDPDRPSDEHFVIVTVSQDNADLAAKLRDITSVDLVAYQGHSDEPELTGDPAGGAIEVTASRLGKYIAWLELSTEAVKVLDSTTFRFRRIAVEENYPRDPAVTALLDEYQLKLRMENLVADEDKLPRRPLDRNDGFTGNASCGYCHKDIYDKWTHFRHGHAMQTLQRSEINREFDPECVGCHTVGMYYEGGFRSMEQTPDLANVGCESCHGPGRHHAENPITEPYQNQFTLCEDCHNHETSPNFEKKREAYFEKIRHWPTPRKYWE